MDSSIDNQDCGWDINSCHLPVSYRLLEIISYKIFAVQREDVLLECLNSAGTKSYRIEEMPTEDGNLNADEELLIPVAHFSKVAFTIVDYLFVFDRVEVSSPQVETN